MTEKRLRNILDSVDDPGVLALGAPEAGDPLLSDWRRAASETSAAYAEWRRLADRDSYAVYRACADRADAAQDALSRRGWRA